MKLSHAMTQGRGNNLHALRLAAAAAVVVSHAWPLAYGPGTPEPLKALTGHSLGGWSVALFFFLSGLLIAQSAASRTTVAFWTARARRILPGLAGALAMTLLLAALSGGVVTPEVATEYILRGLTLVSLEHAVAGAFPANPMPGLVNGPLWSLFHEVSAYALCFAAVRSGLMARWPLVLPVLALALWAATGLPTDLPARLETFAPLFLAFATGMTVWRFRAVWPMSWALLAGLVLVAPFGWPFAVAALGQAAILLAFRTRAIPMRHDLSFGVYVYGWPIAQYILHHHPGLAAPELAVASLVATLPFALTSWLTIEQPSLSFRQRTA